ncbi:hypothetical protein AB0H57_21735 [Micromonospora sp. NPDC050686]|uniref:hypothetical protein n=1 Tax=Micromonospora sp. NPDC050686 TaxID=3154631 RepID=UPI00340F09C5
MVGNPSYVVNIDPGLAVAHDLVISEEERICGERGLIAALGPEPCLRNLLAVLKGATRGADNSTAR